MIASRHVASGSSLCLACVLWACSSSTPPPADPEAPKSGSTVAPDSVEAEEPNPVPSALPSTGAAPPAPPADAGAKAASRGQTLFVFEQRVECQGETTMQCLKVRHSLEDDWQLFYDDIEGFTFEPGHRYELRVDVSKVEGPPADGPTLHYRLLEVVSKQPAER